MKIQYKSLLLASSIAAASSASIAGTAPFFTPLTQSSAVATVNHINELNSPWQVPAGLAQDKLTSMAKIEADIDQSVVRVPGLGSGATMWDMIAFDPTGEYIFIPHETLNGAGVSRYNIAEDKNEILFEGDATGDRGADGTWSSDFGAFDPARFTPYGTVIVGEEWSGEGRVIEIMNPMAAPEDIIIREKNSFANVSHEGISFSEKWDNVVYYVDEDRSGSIYKFVASDDTFDQGQTFVLVVEAFDGDASQNYNADVNLDEAREGYATWERLTKKDGRPVTQNNPFLNKSTSRPGRLAADEVNGTPYGRPEDMEIGTLANGKEALYFTATSERAVYSVEMINKKSAVVRLFASEFDTEKNKGFEPTTGTVDSPDNLAQDALGNIYIIEDAPNSGAVGGDIWFVRDVDNDGVAESLDHFMSIQVAGAEATGMVFNPEVPTQFVVAVQHPSSTNLDSYPEGHGDALWTFDLTNIVPPKCDNKEARNFKGPRELKEVKTCSKDSATNFVKALKKAQ